MFELFVRQALMIFESSDKQEEAWEYLKNDTGIDLKSILERTGK